MTFDPAAECAKAAESRLRAFRAQYGLNTAPVDCFRLIPQLEAAGMPVSLRFTGDPLSVADAVTYYFPTVDCFLILCPDPPARWKESSPARRCNFTLAHELGHIVCGHLKIPESMKSSASIRMEDLEADAFAGRLLMPEDALSRFTSVREAADSLLVSESAVRFRLRETGIRYEKRTCPWCGFSRIPPGAQYCRMCALKLEDRPDREPEADLEYPVGRECPICKSRAPAGPMYYCPDCGLCRRNRCTGKGRHGAPADAWYCEVCGAVTEMRKVVSGWPLAGL